MTVVLSEDLAATQLRPDIRHPPDSRLETIWTLLRLDRGRRLLLCALYRPPRYTAAALDADFSDLESQLQGVMLDHPAIPILMCGDANCDLLKTSLAPAKTRFENFLADYSLNQLVTSPTFTTGSLLDVCIANRRNLVTHCRIVFCDFSPHSIVYSLVSVPRNRPKGTVVQSRSFKQIQSDAILFDLQNCDWHIVYNSPTVDSMWRALLSLFLPVLDKHAPVKSRKIRNPSAPPVTAATRDLMARRRGALHTCGRDSKKYRSLNRSVRSAIRRDTRIDIETRISEQRPHTV